MSFSSSNSFLFSSNTEIKTIDDIVGLSKGNFVGFGDNHSRLIAPTFPELTRGSYIISSKNLEEIVDSIQSFMRDVFIKDYKTFSKIISKKYPEKYSKKHSKKHSKSFSKRHHKRQPKIYSYHECDVSWKTINDYCVNVYRLENQHAIEVFSETKKNRDAFIDFRRGIFELFSTEGNSTVF
jgi:hypothetical protein